jgi:hypothetical protein
MKKLLVLFLLVMASKVNGQVFTQTLLSMQAVQTLQA